MQATTSGSGLSAIEKKQFASSFSTFCINGAVALSVGALLPYIKDTFGLDYAFAGMLVSLHSVGNLISCFLAGLLPLYLGRRKSMMLFSSMIVLAFLLMAFGGSPFTLVLAFLLTGLGRGAVSNFNNKIISEIAPGKAWALNALHASFAVGAFLAPIAVLVFTSNAALGWQTMCYFMVVMGSIELLIYARMPLACDRIERSVKGKGGKNLGFLNEASFWLGTGTLFFYLCAEQGVIGWMVTYFKDSGLMSNTYAQGMASILWILILLGRLTVAWLSTRMSRSTLLSLMGAGFLGFFLIVLFGRTLPVITFGIAGFGFSIAGIYPTTVALSGKAIDKYPLTWSVMLTVASFGAILMPSIIGTVADSAGIYAGISTIVIAIVLAVLFIFANVLRCRKEDKASAQQSS